MTRYVIVAFLLLIIPPVFAQEIGMINSVKAKGIVSAAKAKRQEVYKKALAESYSIRALRADDYYPDTAYEVKGMYNIKLLDQLKLSERIFFNYLPVSLVLEYHIKSIRSICTPTKGYNIDDRAERFDSNGNIVYDRGGELYRYEYNSEGKPATIYAFDGGNNLIATAKYKYDVAGRLVQAGDYLLKYYPNGILKSVEDRHEIERYEYDAEGNLVHINFDIKPRTQACGNRTTEWKGWYNKRHQLIKEEIIGSSHWLNYYRYSAVGILVKNTHLPDYYKKYRSTTKYNYTNGLLTSSKTISKNAEDSYTEEYVYEFY